VFSLSADAESTYSFDPYPDDATSSWFLEPLERRQRQGLHRGKMMKGPLSPLKMYFNEQHSPTRTHNQKITNMTSHAFVSESYLKRGAGN